MEMSIYCSRKTRFILCLLWMHATIVSVDGGGPTYENMTQLFDDVLGSSSSYKTAIRPVNDHSLPTTVNIVFEIVAIVDVDAIQQRFTINGFLGLRWQDEIATWNPADYGGADRLVIKPVEIWRPRLVMTNTLDARDIFKDDISPTTITYLGNATWFPGSLFPTSCKLNLYKYPFDQQHCYIEFFSMGHDTSNVVFSADTETIGQGYFVKSGEWIIESTAIETYTTSNIGNFRLKFNLKRLHGFFIVNIVIPVVTMSFLNILVFVIPVDSGEKIGYGITVLLALTVFMTIVSDQLPRSSDTLPLVTIYLLVLTILSVCTVIVAVFIVRIHHCDKKETSKCKARANFNSMLHKVKMAGKTASQFKSVQVKPFDSNGTTATTASSAEERDQQEKTRSILMALHDMKSNNSALEESPAVDYEDDSSGNKWHTLTKYIDVMSLLVFTLIWLVVTLAFLIEISR